MYALRPLVVGFLCGIGLLHASPGITAAGQVSYSIELTVLASGDLFGVGPGSGIENYHRIPPVGAVYTGSFSFDGDLLPRDGDNVVVPLSTFRLQIENLVWDKNNPFDPLHPATSSLFQGFRAPPIGFTDLSPGLEVRDGLITGLTGGVFSPSDLPNVSFFGNAFDSRDPRGIFADGTLEVTVPAASPLILLLGGLSACLAIKRKVS